MKDIVVNLLLGAANLGLLYLEYKELSWIFSRSPISPLSPPNQFHPLNPPPPIVLIPSTNARNLTSCKFPEIPITFPTVYGVHTVQEDPNCNPWYLNLNGWQVQFDYDKATDGGKCYANLVTFLPPSDCRDSKTFQVAPWNTDYIKFIPQIDWP